MGMHFGILAAPCSWPTLLTALREHAGEFSEAASSGGENWEIEAGEHEGRSYVVDSSYLLSGGAPDLIVTLSKSIPGVVVGCYAETVSGSVAVSEAWVAVTVAVPLAAATTDAPESVSTEASLTVNVV